MESLLIRNKMHLGEIKTNSCRDNWVGTSLCSVHIFYRKVLYDRQNLRHFGDKLKVIKEGCC